MKENDLPTHFLDGDIIILNPGEFFRKFVQNMIKPIESKVYKEDKNVIIELKNSHEKAIIIGKNKRNLKELNKTVKKYFDVNLMVK